MPTVVDANLLLALVLPLPYSEAAEELLDRWLDEGESLISPSIWEYEAVSAVRKYVVQQRATPEQADHLMLGLDSLPVRSVPTDPELRRSALSWADRLGQFAAYDSFYVALAERLGCDVWTADKRLANAAAAVGADIVRSLSAKR
jgi:predicted nucleic acid-binding protein